MSTTSSAERYCPSCERSYHEGKLCPEDGTELVSLGVATDPLIGRSLNDRYTIHERLGAGGMGTVYRGTQHSVGREVAIKVVSPGLVTDPAAIKRFLREAKLSSRLGHPNAVSMLDFGQTGDGLFFLVMELLVGQTLDKVIRAERRLSLPRVMRIADQVCNALEGAHRLSIIHRDLKPANVMLLDGSEGLDLVKVLDFGLAKSLSKDTTSTTMTGSGALLGTPAYMSPEAALARELDERCDLYSLGCMLYLLASGHLPFHSDSVHELVSMQANLPPPPITGVPLAVGSVIMRLLAKDPADRYQTAEETRRALDKAFAATLEGPLAIETTLPRTTGEGAAPACAVAPTVPSAPAWSIVAERAPAAAAIPANAPSPSPARRGPRLAIAGALMIAALGAAALWIANAGSPPSEPAAEEPMPSISDPATPGVETPPIDPPAPIAPAISPPSGAAVEIASPPPTGSTDRAAGGPARRDPKPSRRPTAMPPRREPAGTPDAPKPADPRSAGSATPADPARSSTPGIPPDARPVAPAPADPPTAGSNRDETTPW